MRKPLGWASFTLSIVSWIAVPIVAFLPALSAGTKVFVGGVLYGFSWATWGLCMLLLGPEMLALMTRLKARFTKSSDTPPTADELTSSDSNSSDSPK